MNLNEFELYKLYLCLLNKIQKIGILHINSNYWSSLISEISFPQKEKMCHYLLFRISSW